MSNSKATPQVGEGPQQTAEMRGDHWRSIARRHADGGNGYRLYGGDWAALASTLDGLLAAVNERDALREERDRMRQALEEAGAALESIADLEGTPELTDYRFAERVLRDIVPSAIAGIREALL